MSCLMYQKSTFFEHFVKVETNEDTTLHLNDYEADFESDEFEECANNDTEENIKDEEQEADQQRKAWLLEQAERGRARQRALMSRIENQNESSVDLPETRNFQVELILFLDQLNFEFPFVQGRFTCKSSLRLY